MNSSVLDRPLRLSINPKLIDKNEAGDSRLFSRGWENCRLTPRQLAASIDAGQAFTCELSGSRSKANFVCVELLAVDVDEELSVEEALADPFAREHLTMLYHTPSHTVAEPRFRLVFALPRPIFDADDARAASRTLCLKFCGDRAATDPARLFYGSTNSKPQLFERALTEEALQALIDQGLNADQVSSTVSREGFATTASKTTIPADRMVRLTNGSYLPFKDMGRGATVHCPFHLDKSASAFVVQSRNKRSTGIRCSACVQTFWMEDTDANEGLPDFDARVREAEEYELRNRDIGPFQPALSEYGAQCHPGLRGTNIIRQQGPYIEFPNPLPEGLIFTKSPKGTGKTNQLQQFLRSYQGTVLLIGHRVELLRQTCARLDLDFYREEEGELKRGRLGVCLDSLVRLKLPVGSSAAFADTIIIDESEQVLSHFLSDTLEDKRRKIFAIFVLLLRKAKRVILLDADLGFVTFDTICKLSDATPIKSAPKPSTVIINERRVSSEIDIYASKDHLVGELTKALREGRCAFVASNSKEFLGGLAAGLTTTAASPKSILITADTTNTPEVRAFVKNAAGEALKYDVILASPTLGTGVDITFPGEESLIDVVFGFFEAGITTHTDFDQQIWRVRQPGAVKVWISPQRFAFDTAHDVVRREILENNLFKAALPTYDANATLQYQTDDPFLDLAVLVRSQQLASKNNLKRNFIAMKRSHGHVINYVTKNHDSSAIGLALLQTGTVAARERYVQRLLSASTLEPSRFDEIIDLIKSNGEVTEQDRVDCDRTWIELFYREPLSEELILRDEKGRLREKIRKYEDVMKASHWVSYYKAVDQLAKYGSNRARFVKEKGAAADLLVALFKAAGIFDGKRFLRDAKISLLDLDAFTKCLSSSKGAIENQLGVEVKAEPASAIKTLGKLLDLVGLELEKAGNSKANELAKGRKIYFYKLSSVTLDCQQQSSSKRNLMTGWDFINAHYGFVVRRVEDDEDWKNSPAYLSRTQTSTPRRASASAD